MIAFLTYFGSGCALLALFVALYVQCTPHREFALIAQGNVGAAVALGGAILGFTLPLVSAIYYTMSLVEMAKWAAITGLVQLLVFTLLRRQASKIAEGNVAQGVLVAAAAVAVGLLNAVSISH